MRMSWEEELTRAAMHGGVLTGVENDTYVPVKTRSEKLNFMRKWNGGEQRKTTTRLDGLSIAEKCTRWRR